MDYNSIYAISEFVPPTYQKKKMPSQHEVEIASSLLVLGLSTLNLNASPKLEFIKYQHSLNPPRMTILKFQYTKDDYLVHQYAALFGNKDTSLNLSLWLFSQKIQHGHIFVAACFLRL